MLQLLRIAFGFIFAVLACGLFLAWGFSGPGIPKPIRLPLQPWSEAVSWVQVWSVPRP